MKRPHVAIACACAFALAATFATAGARARVALDYASAYVFRGTTLNDGAVLQPGMEVEGLPIALGIWGNLDINDFDDRLSGSQFSEINLYGSYGTTIDGVDFTFGYTEYLYPNAIAESDRELSVSAGIPMELDPIVTAYYMLDGANKSDMYIEAKVSETYKVDQGMDLEFVATLGYYSDDETVDAEGAVMDGEAGVANYTVGVSASYKKMTASITYVGRVDEDVLADADPENKALGYDVDVVGMVGFATRF